MLRAAGTAALGLAMPALIAQAAAAQELHPTLENGRTVWTNDMPTDHVPAVQPGEKQPKTIPSREYFYWSQAAQRWIPVQVPNPSALRSARKAAGEVNKYIDSKPRLSTVKTKARPAGELAEANPNYAQAAGNRSVSSSEIDKFIAEAAARHKVDPNLVRAVIKVESNYNPRALSNKGAMGLMQLMPATARMYDVRNPFDAHENVEAGVRHLKGLLQNFNGNVPLTLAAYNAGEGAVQRNGGIPPYTETRNYVHRITSLMGNGAQEAIHMTALTAPITVHRDERGHLMISNTD
ncbi:MAG: transglycosylase SLT domain-containing protein [Acidobacteriota bacterium]|nr:transglycosylase SLT domain-containing protein [Acidobacteriota bacterium]